MIGSFKDPLAAQVFHNQAPKGLPPNVAKKARYLMLQLNAATRLDDMKIPPGNKLHRLIGKRAGQHAVWINNQYRLVFNWNDGHPSDCEIIDYHDEKK
jgi:proteic killer suppression protein